MRRSDLRTFPVRTNDKYLNYKEYPDNLSNLIIYLPILLRPVPYKYTFRNQDKKVAFIQVDEDGALARYSEFMKTCHNMNIVFQTTIVDAYSLSGKREIPNKTLANVTIALLINSSHKK